MDGHCINCERVLEDANFCPGCGQKANVHRLSMRDILHDAVHFFTHADKGIFQLLKKLATITGRVAREFVEGRRKRYFPPLNFYLIVAAIYVFMSSVVFKPKPVTGTGPPRPGVERPTAQAKDPAAIANGQAMYKRAGKVRNFMSKYSNLVTMISLPVIAFIFWLFYARAKYNYTEHLVAGMYMSGFCLLIYALLINPISVISGTDRLGLGLFVVFQIIYNGIFYSRFMNANTTWTKIKPFLVSALAVAIWVQGTIVIIGTYIRNGFFGLS